ncbi:hypothetical protein AJ88_24845 [Mesorhizobium amorphae CCBAU 01583]|nr:hypothetical protein AJ88_24845 [Mesorhizobium amorphae CCBAU 01583]
MPLSVPSSTRPAAGFFLRHFAAEARKPDAESTGDVRIADAIHRIGAVLHAARRAQVFLQDDDVRTDLWVMSSDFDACVTLRATCKARIERKHTCEQAPRAIQNRRFYIA